MSQTRLQSFKETCMQTAAGFSVGLISQLVIFPFFDGIDIPFTSNMLLCAWFTGISVARGYIVRRFFNKKHGQDIEEIKEILEATIKLNGELLVSNRMKSEIIKNYEKE